MDLLDKMTTYVRVVEAQSFSAAAKQLGLSAAAVSRQIATLESSLRASLLRRSTRRMAITPAGQRYYERCLRILREVDEAQAVGCRDGVEGPLQVSAPVTFGLAQVVPFLPTLMQAHPGLRIDLRLEDRLTDLILDDVDVAIRVGVPPPDSTTLVAHRLFEFRRQLVAAPSYLKRRGVPKTPEALARHDALAHLGSEPAESWTLVDGAREVRVRVNVVFRSTALHAVRELAITGAGIALLPDILLGDALRDRSLRRILTAWQTDSVVVNAIHRTTQRRSERIRVFIEHLRRSYAQKPAG